MWKKKIFLDMKFTKFCKELRLADATLEIQLTQQIENAGGSAVAAAALVELQKV